ncbi:flagellar export chaperone FliS [Thiohalobacter sp.]|uniref:flagellar export chaperone FliS n=1 Tax=Thiohalobacter sp. TaxID=2025948 RepID=UPI00260344AC|nr:flagellar export chaperone FliS [Thiohalobacter sp.]
MTYTPMGKAQQYARIGTASEVMSASPHRIVQLLLEGALEKVARARGFMELGNVAEKGRHIGLAISVIEGLQASLDKERGGDIARNLDELYDYMSRRLVEANLRDDTAILDEVAGLLREIKSAWDAIPTEMRGDGQADGPAVSAGA